MFFEATIISAFVNVTPTSSRACFRIETNDTVCVLFRFSVSVISLNSIFFFFLAISRAHSGVTVSSTVGHYCYQRIITPYLLYFCSCYLPEGFPIFRRPECRRPSSVDAEKTKRTRRTAAAAHFATAAEARRCVTMNTRASTLGH